MPFLSYAQNLEDVVLFRALKGIERGFYIDVGAQDPEVDSVTKAFYDRGWSGINLEPVARWHRRLSLARPRDVNLNLMVSNDHGQAHFYEIEDSGLSTSRQDYALAFAKTHGFDVSAKTVETVTLASICQQYQVKDIHFLKIDVEGLEREVLEGMDFTRYRPWVVVIEAIHPIDQTQTHQDWEGVLLGQGYVFALFDGVNRFYFDASRTEIAERLNTCANVLDDYVPAKFVYEKPQLPVPDGFGVNLFGQFSSATGLGASARNIAYALSAANIPIACFDLGSYYPTGTVAEELAPMAEWLVSDFAACRYPVNVYCVPLTDVENLVRQLTVVQGANRIHAAVIWWEATKLHPDWISAATKFDAVIGFSDFIAQTLSNALPLTPVLSGNQPLFLPYEVAGSRDKLGLPEDAFVFVSSFDPSSDSTRKNPFSVIEAFRSAFPEAQSDVRLVFRVNNAYATNMSRDALQQLLHAASGDSRIGFCLNEMTYAQVLALYASADAYVSLHRAEGLGLGMLEAMRLGVPVIATAWSGNMSFMDHMSACLVRYRLRSFTGGHPFYRPEVLGRDAVWADPVPEDAIAWMRYLYSNPQQKRVIGKNGKTKAERYQQDAQQLHWVSELIQIWRNRNFLPTVEGKLSGLGKG